MYVRPFEHLQLLWQPLRASCRQRSDAPAISQRSIISVRPLMARQRRRRQPRFTLLLVLLAVTLALLVLGARPAGAPVWRQQQRRNASSSSAGPGRRYGHVAWPDGMGTGGGWLLGGWGIDSAGNEGRLNDLWRTSDGASWGLVGGSTLVANDGLYDLSHETVVAEIIESLPRHHHRPCARTVVG